MLGQFAETLLPQCAGAVTSRRSLLAATIYTAALAAAGPAAADSYDFDVIELSNSVITVESNIDEYTAVTSANLISGKIRVELDAGLSGRVWFWSAWPVMAYQSNDNPGWVDAWGNFQTSGQSETYSVPRPKSVETEFLFSITPAQYGSTMIAACENNADKLRGQGMSNTEIFGSDRWIQVAVGARGDHEMNGIEGAPYLPEVTGWNQYEKVNVLCKGDPVDFDPATQAITAVSLNANEDQNVHGSCELRLSGSITSNEPNIQVKFLYVDDKGNQSNLKSVTTNAEGVAVFEHDYPVNTNKSGKVRMIGQGPPFMSNWADYDVKCGGPSNEKVSALPPKAAVLTVAVDEEVSHQGKICPAVITVIGRVDGRGKASGTVTLGAAGNQIAEKPFSFEDDEKKLFVGKHQISWQGMPATPQNVPLTMVLHNALGDTVDTLQKMKSVGCREPGLAGGAVGAAGGLESGGAPEPTHAQQAGKAAAVGQVALLPGAGFAIQSPKGRVRSGQIRLSGGKPNAKYALRFYRKTENGFKPVRAAKLPKQMVGRTASFDLKALSGSRMWRLEVCPAASKTKTACKTADFRVPPVSAGSKVKAPGKKTETKVFIMPGLGN